MPQASPLESANILEPRAIVGSKTDNLQGLCGKNFFIPSYQRGYRWGKLQVTQLIRDLHDYFNDNIPGNFYCLQPIVVKELSTEQKLKLNLDKADEPWYEVIDGQQRLTTIRIILALRNLWDGGKRANRFGLRYETRPDLHKAFESFEKVITNPDDEDEDERYQIRYNPNYPGRDIDSWHILEAANNIIEFFQESDIPDLSISDFIGNFYSDFVKPANSDRKSVQVLWYELRDTDSDSAPALFKRLNEMCIKLNNAELIRALFLSDSARYSIDPELIADITDTALRHKIEVRERNRKQSHIISQWDMMEQRLHDPQIWSFITNETDKSATHYNCRIEYIFDLVSGKAEDDRDSLTTLLEFERMSHAAGADPLWALWLKVEMYFSTILAWASDRTLYHYIGYLVSLNGRKVLGELLANATVMTKTEFRNDLITRISVELPQGITDIEELSYLDNEHYKTIRQLLVLFNVESTRRLDTEPFFPFDRFKARDWTLEHIHAQNSELIDQSDRDKWSEYITVNLDALRQLSKRFSGTPLDPAGTIERLEQDLDEFKRSKAYSFARFRQMFDLLSAYYDNLAEGHQKADKLHSISNMALLSDTVNSSIGNSAFEVKRQKIIEMDARGEYIPLCTRKVFLKYYNRDDVDFKVAQMFFWSEQDRINYLDSLRDILTPYIKIKPTQQ